MMGWFLLLAGGILAIGIGAARWLSWRIDRKIAERLQQRLDH
jgi:hypothetical protein